MATAPEVETSRKPLDAQFVGRVNKDAMKALGDVAARRKWADSKSGSPVTTNILCAEIARLNIEAAALKQAVTAERKRCTDIAQSLDSGRGNESQIVGAIEMGAEMTLTTPERENQTTNGDL